MTLRCLLRHLGLWCLFLGGEVLGSGGDREHRVGCVLVQGFASGSLGDGLAGLTGLYR